MRPRLSVLTAVVKIRRANGDSPDVLSIRGSKFGESMRLV